MRIGLPLAIGLLLLVLAPTSRARACPSGLNLIPTADMLDDRELAVEYLLDGEQLFDRDCDHWLLLQAGIGGRLELGVDRCLRGDNDTIGNVKYLLSPPAPGRPAVAVGVQALAGEAAAQPYLVASAEAAHLRLHAGVIGIEHQGELMLGLEAPLSPRLTLLADHLTGSDNGSGIGLSAELNASFYVTASRYLANTAGESAGWQLVFSYYYQLGG
jgi:hypothetical protein